MASLLAKCSRIFGSRVESHAEGQMDWDGPNVSKSYLELTVNTFVGKCFLLHGKADDLARILILSKAGGTPRRRAQNPPEFFAVSRRT
jgi:hypothetical protein